jgi:hypothetical protein
MSYNQYQSNSDDQNSVTGYNLSCAGKNCKNITKHHLMLVLIKRSGWFCANCRQSLQEDGLVESVFKESTIMNGDNNFGKV